MNYRKYAKGKPCMIRLPGCLSGSDNPTTVLTHYRLAGYGGVASKPDDVAFGAWGCASCHDIVDGRKKIFMDHVDIRKAHAEGVLRTVAHLRKEDAL